VADILVGIEMFNNVKEEEKWNCTSHISLLLQGIQPLIT